MPGTGWPSGPVECHSDFGDAPSALFERSRLGCSVRRRKRMASAINSPKHLYTERFSYFQGKVFAQGTPEDLARSGVDFVTLAANVPEDPAKQTKGDRNRRFSQSAASIHSVSTIASSKAGEKEEDGSENGDAGDDNQDEHDRFIAPLEESSKGRVQGSVAMNYFAAGAHWSVLAITFVSFLVTQILASSVDIWVSDWPPKIDLTCF